MSGIVADQAEAVVAAAVTATVVGVGTAVTGTTDPADVGTIVPVVVAVAEAELMNAWTCPRML